MSGVVSQVTALNRNSLANGQGMFWKQDAFPESSYLLQLTGRIGSWASRASNLEGLVGIGTYVVKDPGMRLGKEETRAAYLEDRESRGEDRRDGVGDKSGKGDGTRSPGETG